MNITFLEIENEYDAFDCIMYMVDPSYFLWDDLLATLESLAPHQALIIAVIINAMVYTSSETHCLLKFPQSLGGYNSSPLAIIRTNWRLWSIECHHRNFINWSDLLGWGCYDVISAEMKAN
ncbi:unnamed protein product [Taenia asiatica]|uniref:DREV methyltransferase n=1 Tax=Taenia asiatica TaxID=60517 RepID=A0A0R3WE51_TAEAS|nr:unnamed protein product [Taenia asiatica]